ncbi:MAG: PilZ domain-containing protein [SAR324 cluster bacterium]|nr:PilZ domain-containing protein [SAR324 cluster bacterium]
MDNERTLKRNQLLYYLKVFDNETNEVLGRLLDVTTEGMLIFSEKPVTTDKFYKIKLTLPKDIVVKTDIFLEALSLHCKKDPTADFYNTGFRIVDIEDEDKLTLIRIINRFSFQG